MSNYLSKIKKEWQILAKNKLFRNQFLTALVFLTILLIILPKFLAYVETRHGTIINDPILNLFTPIDLTWLIFIILYGTLGFALFYLITKPMLLLIAITTYAIMIFFRIIAMYLLPLDPPVLMIALYDPFVGLFEKGTTLTRDLFFSGHTAIMFILYLVSKNKKIKSFFLVATIAIAGLVLLQHVHYTVDVFVAFFAAFAAYSIAVKIIRQA